MTHRARRHRLGRAAFVLVVCMLAQVVGVMPAFAAPPILLSTDPDNAEGNVSVSTSQIYFYYDVDIAPRDGGDLSAITMFAGVPGDPVPVPFTASIAGTTLTLTLEDSLPYSTACLVTIPANTLENLSTGEDLDAEANLSFGTEIDANPPTLYDSWIRADKVTLQFWDAESGMDITAEIPDPDDFTVTVGGVPVPVVSVDATSGGFLNLVLTLQDGVVDTTTDIDLAYDYNAAEADNPIVDNVGVSIDDFTIPDLENKTPADLDAPQMDYAFVLANDPTVVQVFFNENMKAVGASFDTGFTIEVDGTPVSILEAGFNADRRLVQFATDTTIASTDSVTVAYTGTGGASDDWDNMLGTIPEAEVHNFGTGYDVSDAILFPTIIRTTADPVTFVVSGADMSAGMGTLAVLIHNAGSECWAEITTYNPMDPDYAVFTSSAHTFADDASTTVYTFDVLRQIVSGINIPLATATFTVSPTASAVQISAPDIDVDASDLANVGVTWADVMVYGGPGTVSYQLYRSLNPKTALEDPEGECWVETLVNANATSPCSDNLTTFAADYRQARYMVQATYEDGSPVSQSSWSPPIVIPLPDAPGNLQFNNPTYSVAENAGTATITVTRTGGSTGTVSVDYATADGAGDHPGLAGTDYTAASGNLEFAAGETSMTFEVTVADDAAVDGDKTVNLALVGASLTGGASLGGNSTAVLTIVDNEAPSPGVLAFSLATGSKSESVATANITVIRTGGADGTVTVDYEVTAGTASSGNDYTLVPGTLTFENGETSKTIEVAITNDTDQEGPEFLVITLSNPGGGATLGAESSYSLTISDNDLPIVWNDADADHIYYHGDDIAFTITGSGIPNGAPARVAVGVYTELGFDTTLAPLTGMNRQATSYYYVNSTSVGGNLSVSGFVNNPGNNTLPAGLLAIQVYISMDMGATWTAAGPAIPLIASGDQIGGLVGIIIPPGAGVTVTPGFETLTSLFSTNVPITFSKSLPGLGEGSITFPAGLDIVNFSEELQALDEGVNMLGDADALTGEVTYVMGIDTADLSFLSSSGATIAIDGLPAGFTNPVITTDGTGDASVPVIDGDLLTFDVTHFSNYTIMGDVVIPVTTVTVTPESVTLAPTETSQLTADVDPDDASEPGVTWSSSNDAIASVSATGLVTANSVGSAVITATSDDNGTIKDTCAVTVRIAATGVSLPESLSLDVPQTATLTATLIPIDATNQAVTWQSSNEDVATVVSLGGSQATVTAIGKGNATITATTVDGGHTDTCAVTVTLRVSSVGLDHATMAIEPGETGQLTSTVNPAGASNPAVTWQSSDATKAQVDGDGTVTGVAAGTADITVTTVDGGKTATCAVTIGAVAPAWPVGTSTVTTAGVAKTGLTLNWSAATDRVAVAAYRVYRDGTLIHTTANGATQTYAVAGLTAGTQYTFKIEAGDALNAWSTTGPSVTVTTLPEPVTGVTLLPDTVSLETGDASVELTATVAPIGPPAASNQAITWSSSAPGVAAVVSTGATTASVTPVGPGTATITVTTTDGSFTDTCAVTVTRPATGVSLLPEEISIEPSETTQLTATVAPADASDKNVTWLSSNTDAATVNGTGLVTGVANGSATITVTTVDGSFTDTCVVTVGAVAPAWPVGTSSVTTASVTKTGLTLNWSAATDHVAVAAYRVYRDGTLIHTTANGTTRTYAVTGLTAGTQYTFVVEAGDGVAWSADGPSVTVTTSPEPVTGVTLDLETLSRKTTEGAVTLTATVAPADATNKAITWSSSNNAVATVSSTVATTASVTPVGPGTATITVTTTDGSYTDTCVVTVTQPVTGVTLNLETLTMEVGQTAQLTAVVAPANASNKTLEWGSSNNAYATLVGNPGNVTGTVTAVAVTAGLPGGTVAVGAQAAEDNTKVDVCAVTILEGAAPAWAAEGTSLTASGISSSGLTLTWSNTATDNVAVTQYRIYRGETLVGTVNAPTLTYSVTGLSASTEYTFTVQAGDASGRWSTTGPSATATTAAAPPSGGGSTPPPAAKPPVIEGNKADVTGSSTVTTSTNTNGTTTSTVTVTQSTINQALSTDSGVNQVVVKVTGTAQEQATSLPAQSFTTMTEKQADLVVQTEKANLSIPPQVVNVAALSEALNVAADQIQVRVSIQEVAAAEADSLKSKIAILDENLQPVGSILQLNIEATAAGKSVKIDTFGDHTVTGEIPFSPASVQGDVRKLCVYRFNETTQAWEPVPSRVDAATGKVTFFTDHFSNYTIMSLEKTFADLTGHWAKDDVELMASRWVVKGDTATTYAPERDVTRAEFAALLVRALGLKEKVVQSSTFSDVATTSWYSGSVEAAAAAGIVSGVGSGAFAPEANITREEMAAMVVRAMGVAGSPVSLSSGEAALLLGAFADQSTIDAWASDDLAKAVKSGIVQGVSSTEIAPLSCATRAEAATMVKRLMEKAGLL